MKKIIPVILILGIAGCDSSSSDDNQPSQLLAESQLLLTENRTLWASAGPADYMYKLQIGESTRGCNNEEAVDLLPQLLVSVEDNEVHSVWNLDTQEEVSISWLGSWGTMEDNFEQLQNWLDQKPVFIGLPFSEDEALPEFHASLGYPLNFGARYYSGESCNFRYIQIWDFQ